MEDQNNTQMEDQNNTQMEDQNNTQNEKYEALESAREYLQKLIPGLKSISENFRQGDVSTVSDFVDGMQGVAWLVEVMQLTEDCHDVRIDLMEVNDHLEAMTEALTNSDLVLVADITQYEIIPILDQCSEALQSFSH